VDGQCSALLVLAITGAHMSFWPLVRLSLVHANLVEANLLLAGLIIFCLVLPLNLFTHLCALMRRPHMHQCMLQRFLQRMAESQLFISLP
jgi:hypothetical protein